jgi:hypothetical protein
MTRPARRIAAQARLFGCEPGRLLGCCDGCAAAVAFLFVLGCCCCCGGGFGFGF